MLIIRHILLINYKVKVYALLKDWMFFNYYSLSNIPEKLTGKILITIDFGAFSNGKLGEIIINY
jgi:hypothetical protein